MVRRFISNLKFSLAPTSFFLLIVLLLNSCSMHWTKALQLGTVQDLPFNENIQAKNKVGLLFVPVTVEGKEYLFLFDSGAPLSISQEMQNEFRFKSISSSKIVDTDNQTFKVDYIQLPELKLGNVAFQNQTAFVADFKANPILNCLEIDGIIGSNLMRLANWEIDIDLEKIRLSNSLDSSLLTGYTKIPFRTDRQYNIKLDIGIDTLTLRNITLDFGSNGSLSVPEHSFDLLQKGGAISTMAVEEGWSRAGLSGNRVLQTERIALLDSVLVGSEWLTDVKLSSGSSSLLGLKALANYSIVLDWTHRTLYLKKKVQKPADHRSLGFTLGVLNDTSFYIQTVHKYSKAEEAGLRPNLKVLSLNNLVFNKNATYCDYVALMSSMPDQMRIEFLNEEGNRMEATFMKDSLFFMPLSPSDKESPVPE